MAGAEEADLSNGGACSNEVCDEGIMAHIEVCNEAPVHDELPLQIVHHTEAHAEAHEDVCPVKGACTSQSYLP